MELSHCVTLHCCLCKSICVVIDSHSIIYESQSPMNPSGSTAQPLFIPFNLLVWLSIAVLLAGWCGAGADHYEPLIAHPSSYVSQEKVAMVL